MKIIRIFADQLFAFHYKNEADNELRRLLNQWNDTAYLYQFVTQHKADVPKNVPIQTLINQLIDNANYIDDTLNEISTDPSKDLEEFFKPLDNPRVPYCGVIKTKRQKELFENICD